MVSWKSFARVFGNEQGNCICRIPKSWSKKQGCKNRVCSTGSGLGEQHKGLSMYPGV